MPIPEAVIQVVNVEPKHEGCKCTGCVVDGFLTITLCKIHKAGPELLEALQEASDHLDYIGYGDSYERECAESSGLESKISNAIDNAGEN